MKAYKTSDIKPSQAESGLQRNHNKANPAIPLSKQKIRASLSVILPRAMGRSFVRFIRASLSFSIN